MVPVSALWLPILVAAVLVFAASSVIWMFLPYHKNDYGGMPNEDAFRELLRTADLAPGQYHVPHAETREEYQGEEVQRKMAEGPNAVVMMLPEDYPAMGKQFVQWFLYAVLVGVVVAVAAGGALPPGAEYLEVFRATATVAFAGYGLAYVGDAIWFGRPWSFSAKMVFDAFVYGLLTAGAFGWLWPA